MNSRLLLKSAAALALSLAAFVPALRADPLIKTGDVVAIIGDSITESRQYSTLIEDYLLMCQPVKVRTIQFGWSGENVVGLNNRIPDFLTMKPTVATLCYGMNDGRYTPVNDEIRDTFRTGLRTAVESLQKGGVKVLVGSPGCVDSQNFYKPTVTAVDYNVNLTALRDEAAGVAKFTGSAFADVHTPMFTAMEPAKLRFGRNYAVAGNDGFHPGPSGGLAMAYAFLKGLGFDGDIGSIRIDLTNKTAFTSGRHEITKLDGNTLTLTSRAYPFCFSGDTKTGEGTVGLIDFLPFNADLNRFPLTVVGKAPKYRVTWGRGSKEFTAEQLKAGINLAAEFIDNPFVGPFMSVHQKVWDKQTSEILLLKQLLHSLIASEKYLPEKKKELDALAAALPEAQAKLADEVAKAIVPVTHTITLEPIQ